MFERNIDQLPLTHPLQWGGQSHTPGMYLDWELNWQPFSLQDDAQPTEPHQSGHRLCYGVLRASTCMGNHHHNTSEKPLLISFSSVSPSVHVILFAAHNEEPQSPMGPWPCLGRGPSLCS